MSPMLLMCLLVWVKIDTGVTVSPKLDFIADEDDVIKAVNNTSKTEDEDVEVKHTIVVSTKLKNNNRRGIISASDADSGLLTYNIGQKKYDSGEVPIVAGYKGVESTQIRTPDSRNKPKAYPDVFIDRNIRDDYDTYPNVATNPLAWKPSTFFNNINWWNPDNRQDSYNRLDTFNRQNVRQEISSINLGRRYDKPLNQNPGQIHRKITNDGMKEFYCKKCRELSCNEYNNVGIRNIQQRSNPWTQTTTPKVKIDGKLTKLN